MKHLLSATLGMALFATAGGAATLNDTFSTNSGNWTGVQPPGAAYGTFPQNPSTPPSITAADANSDGDFMRLSAGTIRHFTTLGFDALGAESYARISGSFDFRMTCLGARVGFAAGGCADGFAFSLLDTATFGSSGRVQTATGDAVIAEGSDITDYSEFPVRAIDGSFSVGFAIFAPSSLNPGTIWVSDGDRFNSTAYLARNASTVDPGLDIVTGINSAAGRFLTAAFDVDFESDLFSLSIIDGATSYTFFDDLDISQFGLDAYNSRLAFGTRSGDAGLFVDVDNIAMSFVSAAAVPLPSGLPLILTGLGAFSALRLRKRKSAPAQPE